MIKNFNLQVMEPFDDFCEKILADDYDHQEVQHLVIYLRKTISINDEVPQTIRAAEYLLTKMLNTARSGKDKRERLAQEMNLGRAGQDTEGRNYDIALTFHRLRNMGWSRQDALKEIGKAVSKSPGRIDNIVTEARLWLVMDGDKSAEEMLDYLKQYRHRS